MLLGASRSQMINPRNGDQLWWIRDQVEGIKMEDSSWRLLGKGRKKSNLEVNPGIAKPKNSFTQSVSVGIARLAADTGIQLGVDDKSQLESIIEI
jgi:hypothetical protein